MSLRSTGQSLVAGALLGGIGGVIGAFLGYDIRRRLNSHIKDLVVAVSKMLLRSDWHYFLFRGNANDLAASLRRGMIRGPSTCL